MKINKKGFSVIQLLVVLIIIGALITVVVPAITKKINNAKKKEFISVAKNYLEGIKKNISTDDVQCFVDDEWQYISEVPDGIYYFMIDSTKNATQQLVKTNGKSPWEDRDVRGYIKWEKKSEVDTNGNPKATYTYKMAFTDTGKVGFTSELDESSIRRRRISMSNASVAATYPSDNGANACTLIGFTLEYSDVEFTIDGVKYKSAYPTWQEWFSTGGSSTIWIGCNDSKYVYKADSNYNKCDNPGQYIYEEVIHQPIKASDKIKQGVNYLSENA